MQFKISWESHLKSYSELTNVNFTVSYDSYIYIITISPCKVYKLDRKQFLYSEFGSDSLMTTVCIIVYPIFI